MKSTKVRQPAFAGSWYPANASDCEREIRGFLEEGQNLTPPDRNLVAGIVPHAGWYFSGSIACNVIHCLKGDAPPDAVVVFGMHLHPDSACYMMDEGVVEALIKGGSDENAKDMDGKSPLDYAVFLQNIELIHTLKRNQPIDPTGPIDSIRRTQKGGVGVGKVGGAVIDPQMYVYAYDNLVREIESSPMFNIDDIDPTQPRLGACIPFLLNFPNEISVILQSINYPVTIGISNGRRLACVWMHITIQVEIDCPICQ